MITSVVLDLDCKVIGPHERFTLAVNAAIGHLSPQVPVSITSRAVHVAETDEKAREEAEGPLLESRRLGREGLSNTRIGYQGRNEGTPSQNELARVFQGMGTSLDFWIDNGLALVGSPETVTAKLQEQRELIGYDIFCAAHRIGRMPKEQSLNSLQLFAKEVMPAFE